MLKVKELVRPIGSFSLKADFTIRSGERVALVGRSGGGKTSLLRLIAGLMPIKPGSGQIFLNDKEITDQVSEKREIGLVFQQPALFTALNVIENVTFGLRVRGLSRKERQTRGWAALSDVGLQNRAGAPIRQLSGGEAQRVALLRALIWEPKLLLLDEPFTGLDHAMKERLQSDLLQLLVRKPIPVIFVTHQSSDVDRLATRRIELIEEKEGQTRIFRD